MQWFQKAKIVIALESGSADPNGMDAEELLGNVQLASVEQIEELLDEDVSTTHNGLTAYEQTGKWVDSIIFQQKYYEILQKQVDWLYILLFYIHLKEEKGRIIRLSETRLTKIVIFSIEWRRHTFSLNMKPSFLRSELRLALLRYLKTIDQILLFLYLSFAMKRLQSAWCWHWSIIFSQLKRTWWTTIRISSWMCWSPR